jgi:hypothetical protein
MRTDNETILWGSEDTFGAQSGAVYTINNKELQNMSLPFKAVANSQSLYMSGNNTLYKCTFANSVPSCTYRRIIKDMSTRAILESSGLVSVFFLETTIVFNATSIDPERVFTPISVLSKNDIFLAILSKGKLAMVGANNCKSILAN